MSVGGVAISVAVWDMAEQLKKWINQAANGPALDYHATSAAPTGQGPSQDGGPAPPEGAQVHGALKCR
jgi:hypothetical protein